MQQEDRADGDGEAEEHEAVLDRGPLRVVAHQLVAVLERELDVLEAALDVGEHGRPAPSVHLSGDVDEARHGIPLDHVRRRLHVDTGHLTQANLAAVRGVDQ